MNDTKMDSTIKKLRERGYRIEVVGPSPEGRFLIGVNGELKTYGEVWTFSRSGGRLIAWPEE